MIARAALGLALGIAVGDWIGAGPAAAVLAGVFVGGWVLVRALVPVPVPVPVPVRVPARVRVRVRVPAGVLVPVLAFGYGLVAQGQRPRAPAALTDGERWTLEGVVVSPPERTLASVRTTIDLVAVERDGVRRAATARVRLSLDDLPRQRILPGDHVRTEARLHAPRGFLNPGAPDARKRAASEGIAATGTVPAATLEVLPIAPAPSLRRAVAAVRARMLAAIGARLDGDAAALVASLVLGDRGAITQPVDDAFRGAGVYHVLSVSGLHLAIAAFLFYVGLRRALVRVPGVAASCLVRRGAAAAALPAVIGYTLLTGAAVATVRSCVVAIVCLVAVIAERRPTTAQALATAALLLLAASPLELFDPSFQLSFAAAAGTGLLAPRFLPAWQARAWPLTLARFFLGLVIASSAAIVATTPICAWHFAQFAPGGVLSNLVVVPLAELGVVPLGLAGAVAALVHAPGASLLLGLAGALARVMTAFTVWFAHAVPAWHVPAPSAFEIAAWYVGLVAVAARARRQALIACACLLAFALSTSARLFARARAERVIATFLDVGQGDACVVELPRGHVLVVDGGGSFDPKFDPGRQVIAPFLHRRGIATIDLIVLSHPHPDHANGLAFLVEDFDVRAIWTNGQETRQPGTLALLAAAARRGVPVVTPRPLALGGARVTPLAPYDETGAFAVDAALGENDNSLVVDVGWRGRRLLFAGDLEAEGEAALLARAGALASDVVKVPHHGSKTSSTAAFVAATHPRLAVISVGEHNRWHFPNPAVVGRWQAAGARVCSTDRDGAVTVTVDKTGALAATLQRGAR